MNKPPKTDFNPGRKFILPLLLLLLFPFGDLDAQGCDCSDCQGPIQTLSSEDYILPISGATNNDLSSPGQGVCGVFIDIEFVHIWSLTIQLTSPSGQTITLMGPYDNFAGSTGGSSWDISFLPCTDPVSPDVFPITYNDQWTNLQQWAFGINYTGSYYPYQGCLENFIGPVNGDWVLTVTNGSSFFDTGSLNGFSILFCDPTGTNCMNCDADAGDLSVVADIDLCQGEAFNGNIDPSYPFGGVPNNQYSYTYVISQNSIVENFNTTPDFSSFDPGNYEICGLSYLTSDVGAIPPPNGSMTVSDLENIMNNTAPFCSDLSDDCFFVNIFSPPPTVIINDNFCENEPYEYGGNSYDETGVYNVILTGATCDTIVQLNLTELSSTIENIAMTICQGDTFFIENNFYTTAGNYSDTLQNINNCDSIINLELDVLNPQSNIANPPMITCTNPEITINGGGSTAGSGVTYLWTTSDGNITGNTLSNNTTVDAPGTYYLSVTINQNGTICTDMDSVQVTVNTGSLPTVDAGVDSTLTCGMTSLILQATGSSGAGFLVEWTSADGNIVSDTFTLNPIIDAIGTYVLTITNTTTNCSAQDSILIDQNIVFPNITLGQDTMLTCNITEIDLDATGSSIGANIIYAWFTSDGNILSGNDSLIATVDSSGTYELTITDMDNQCSVMETIAVTFDTLPPIADAGIDTIINCKNPTIDLDGSNSSAGDFSYLWTTSNGAAPTNETTLQPTISAAGGYELLVTNNQTGCSSFDSIFVGGNFAQPLATAGQDTFITCTNPIIFLDGMGSSSGLNFTYQWTTIGGNILSGQNSLQAEINSAGTYQIVVSDVSNGCTMSDEVMVSSDNDLPIADAGMPDSITCSQGVIVLDGTLSSVGGDINYLWETGNGNIISGANTTQPQVDEDGLYILTVSNSVTGCSAQSSVLIGVDTLPPNANAGLDTFLTCENNTILLDGNDSSLGTNFSYQWTTGGTSSILNPTSLTPEINEAGTFQLEVINDQNGCSAIDEVQVNWDTIPPIADAGPNEILNCQIVNITLGGNASVGSNINYEWFYIVGGNIISDTDILNVTVDEPATYVLEVTDVLNGCTATDAVVVTENIALPTVAAIPSDTIPCSATSISLDGTGSSFGTEYSYLWTTTTGNVLSGETTLFPVVDTAGFYTLTVTNNDNQCEADTVVNVLLENCAPIANAGANGMIDCNQPTLNLDGSGSSVGIEFTYFWTTVDGSILSGENTLSPLVDSAGLYVLTVENTSSGLTTTDTVEVGSQIDLPVVNLSVNELLGCVNTSVFVSSIGSASGVAYTYLWTTAGGSIGTVFDQDSIEANASGMYFLEITNTNNGCSNIDSIEVFQDNSLPIVDAGGDLDLNCFNAQITLDGSGSSVGINYSYLWTTSDGNIIVDAATLTPLVDSSGTYILQVTDSSNGCVSLDSTIVLEDFISPNIVIEQPGIITCTDSILTLDGGNSSMGNNFLYQWITVGGNILSGENSLTPDVNLSGNYQLEIFNTANGCSDSLTVFVDENFATPTADAGTDETIACGVPSIFLDGTNSVLAGNSTFIWTTNDGNVLNNNNTLTPEISTAGTYFLTIENTENGCVDSNEVVISTFNCNPTAVIDFPDSLTCAQTEVTLDGSGSSSWASLIFEWSTGNGNIVGVTDSIFVTVNQPGEYFLTITDTLNTNISFASVTVGVSDDLPVANAGETDTLNCSIVQLNLNGSTSISNNTITYQWSTNDGNIISGDQTLSPLIDSSGIYFLEITNTVNGCSSQDSVLIIEDLENPMVDIEPAGIITCTDSILTLDGGNSSLGNSFEYTWSSNDGFILSGENTLTPAINSGGNYQLEILNNVNGCRDSLAIFVDENIAAPTAVAGGSQNIDCGVSSVILDGTNSVLAGNSTFIWTTNDGNILNNNNTLTAEVSTAGTYLLTIENSENGCVDSSEILITASICIPVSAIVFPDTLNCSQTEVTLDGSASSDWTSIVYAWTTPNGNIVTSIDSNFATVNQPGDYILTVTDTLTDSIAVATVTVILDSDIPFADAGETDTLNCLVTSINLDGSASTTGGNISYEWTTMNGNIISGVNSDSPLIDSAGMYNLLVTNTVNNCSAMDSVFIEMDTISPVAIVGDPMPLTCEDTMQMLDGNGSSEGSIFTYNWNTSGGNILSGNNNLTSQITAPGTYTLTVQSTQNFCEANAQVLVVENIDLPDVIIEPAIDLTCNLIALQLDASNSSSGNNFNFDWQTLDGNIVSGNQTLLPQINEGGDYELTILNTQNGCSNSAIISVFQDTIAPISIAGNTVELTCVDTFLNLDATGSSIGNEFSYQWNSSLGNIVNGDDSLFPEINSAGIYELEVTNNNNMCTSESEVVVTQDIETPIINIETPDLLNCAVENISLDAGSSSNGLIFNVLWSTSDGEIDFGENTLAPQVSDGGTYELMILNTENGCSDSSSILVLQDTISPVAAAGMNMMLTCVDVEMNLDGSNSSLGNEFSYAWETTTGNIISGENSLQPLIDQTGFYQLQVLNNDNQCAASDSVEVTQNIDAPIVEINTIGGLVLNCDVSSIVLDGAGSSPIGNVSFEWTTLTGNILTGANNSNPEVDLLGEYTLTLTNDLNGCTSTGMIEIFEDFEPPVISILSPDILTCLDTILTLDGTGSSEGNEFEYLWTTSNGNIVSGVNNLIAEINASGIYILTISNTENGCSVMESIEVFQDINSPIVDAGGSYEFDCIQTEMMLQGTASQGNEFSYLWTTSNGNIISGATTLAPIIDAFGNYTLTVINSNNGCEAVSVATVTEDLDQPVGLEYMALPPLCFGDFNGSIAIENVIGGESPYLFSFQNQPFAQNLLFENLPAGDYPIIVQDASGCEFEIMISLVDPPEVMVELGEDQNIELGASATLQAVNNIPSSELDSIVWTSSSHEIDCADCVEQEVMPLVSTNYSVWLMNENGCVTEDNIIVYVSNEKNIFIPNIFTPNGDGVNDVFMVYGGIGIEEVETFQIFSRWGELVFSQNKFQPNDSSKGWDGYFRGQQMNPAVFIFFAKVKYLNGETEIIKGDLILK